ncbi:hypothetical protein CKM354_000876200 [Cercospora kikuchii]|uniref:HTH araC/xylS-type domain-containing protein n=1 Tax=Cercospora kikuchii TaxID=84275 RepID=A0A9P3FFK1_9PEZI|nr:uncharacterized protein CKM354_000876200 [Cercospora kikuchii]GIZ45603.1 hypothetical protein CKM354_000876200 [Cercospora kikuchii]
MSPFTTDSTRWHAVRTKDPKADGQFVYCVKTTRIYCRPVCKARLARYSNVEFFDTGSEAVAAGYRACKRCRPELEVFVPQADQAIERICKKLDALPEDATVPSLEILAKEAGLTKYHFHRSFKKATGFTPREYLGFSRRERTAGSMNMTPAATFVPDLITGTTASPVSLTEDWNTEPSRSFKMEELFSFDDLVEPEVHCDPEAQFWQ